MTPNPFSKLSRFSTGGSLADRLRVRIPLKQLLGCLLFVTGAQAEILRVSNCNLEGLGANEAAVMQSAEVLKALSPDLILLQGVRDWNMCRQIVERLKPAEYFVAVCSAFPEPRNARESRQVAVLSRHKPYFFWSEPWRTPVGLEAGQESKGGFAFVAVQAGGQRLGFFSADLSAVSYGAESLKQLLAHASSVTQWEANKVQTFVVGIGTASADTKGAMLTAATEELQKAGYSAPFQEISAAQIPATSSAKQDVLTDSILAQTSVFPGRPVLSSTLTLSHPVLTCDLELDPARVAAAWTGRAQELERLATETRNRQKTEAREAKDLVPAPKQGILAIWLGGWRLAVVSGVGTLLLIALWRMLSSQRVPGGAPSGLLGPGITSSYSLVLPAPNANESGGQKVLDNGQATPVLELGAAGPAQSGRWQGPVSPTPEVLASGANFVQRRRVAEQFLRWMKRSFLRKLLADRNALLDTQHRAALKALKVDERLARIEKQIQQQTRNYEVRIDELTRELLAAREENRELIRARIAQVKLEMEAVRARMLAEAREQLS